MLAILLMNVFAPTIDHYVVQANVKKRKKRASKAIAAQASVQTKTAAA
jgi:Na+-transporting NADH:ubiquinone oxidoreductase subunit B